MHSRLNQVNENLSCSLDMGILINRLSSQAVFSSLSLRSMAGVSHVAGLSRTSLLEEALSQTCNLAVDKGLVPLFVQCLEAPPSGGSGAGAKEGETRENNGEEKKIQRKEMRGEVRELEEEWEES